jgi:hypothetical protein
MVVDLAKAQAHHDVVDLDLKRAFRERIPGFYNVLKGLWRFPERVSVLRALQTLRQIQGIPRETLVNQAFLESFIPRLGLHPSGGKGTAEYEWPASLADRTGKGLQVWQYPHQFSKYLAFVSAFKISSYLEIGVAYGGTFVLTVEYLSRLNSGLRACCVDVRAPSLLFDVYSESKNFTYVEAKSTDLFSHISSESHFDLVFIDGDHSRQGVINDFLLVKDRSSLIGFHDIVNFKTPGTVDAWAEIKRDFGDSFSFYEFVDQYPELLGHDHEKTLLGIGVAVKKGMESLVKI